MARAKPRFAGDGAGQLRPRLPARLKTDLQKLLKQNHMSEELAKAHAFQHGFDPESDWRATPQSADLVAEVLFAADKALSNLTHRPKLELSTGDIEAERVALIVGLEDVQSKLRNASLPLTRLLRYEVDLHYSAGTLAQLILELDQVKSKVSQLPPTPSRASMRLHVAEQLASDVALALTRHGITPTAYVGPDLRASVYVRCLVQLNQELGLPASLSTCKRHAGGALRRTAAQRPTNTAQK